MQHSPGSRTYRSRSRGGVWSKRMLCCKCMRVVPSTMGRTGNGPLLPDGTESTRTAASVSQSTCSTADHVKTTQKRTAVLLTSGRQEAVRGRTLLTQTCGTRSTRCRNQMSRQCRRMLSPCTRHSGRLHICSRFRMKLLRNSNEHVLSTAARRGYCYKHQLDCSALHCFLSPGT